MPDIIYSTKNDKDDNYTYNNYLFSVIPFVISALTIPLLGAVDTALMGHLDASYVGGVAVGVVIFNTLYWLFGFFRISTAASVAQYQNNTIKQYASVFRSLLFAIVIGILFILFQHQIFDFSLTFFKPAPEVITHTRQYFFTLIWAAPFTLTNYVLIGFLMGISRLSLVILLQIFVNLLNIGFAILFVWGFDMQVQGVATATLIAQICATLLNCILIYQQVYQHFSLTDLKGWLSSYTVEQSFKISVDLFIRTFCLLIVMDQFVATGALFGTNTLAANAILFQIHYLMSYFFDGIANALSVLSGQALGQKNQLFYRRIIKYSFYSCLLIPLALITIWFYLGNGIIQLFTHQDIIVIMCQQYGWWLVWFPVCGAFGLIFYGVFAGLSFTQPIRYSMVLALIIWFLGWYFLVPAYSNNGLWMAFLLFNLARSLFLSLWLPATYRYFN